MALGTRSAGTRARAWAAILVLVAAVACSGDPTDDAADAVAADTAEASGTIAVDDAPTEASTSAACRAVEEPEPGLDCGNAYSVSGALAEVPADVDQTGLDLVVITADLDAVTALSGIDPPSDAASLTAWTSALSVDPVSGSAPVLVPLDLVQPVGVSTIRSDDDLATATVDLGWSLLDVDAFVSATLPEEWLVVIAGDVGPATFDGVAVTALAEGIVSAGDGEDRQVDVAGRTPVRPLGQPTRMATREGRIGAGLSTELVLRWTERTDALAGDESWSSVAAALDRADAVSAVLTRTRGPSQPWTDLGPDVPSEVVAAVRSLAIGEPFDVLGVGWSVVGDERRVRIAYHFEDPAAASRQVAQVGAVLRDGWTALNEPLGELLDVQSVASEGALVVADVVIRDGQPSSAVHDMVLQRRDLPFVYVAP